MSKAVKTKKIKVISICRVCKEPVCATQNDLAYRHGFDRYKTRITTDKFSQEDGKPCPGSGCGVIYKRTEISAKK